MNNLQLSVKINPKLKIIYEPLPSDDPNRRRPNISLAKEYLDWEPKISFDDGLDKTINYFTGKAINESFTPFKNRWHFSLFNLHNMS